LLLCSITSVYAAKDVDPRLRTFAAQKRQQTEELARKLHLDVPAEAHQFFQAAETGNWVAVSNAFERIRPSGGTNGTMPALRNVLYVPIHETFGAYAEFHEWDGTMLQKFADGILQSLPAGSIYFGGTGSGRFIITAVRDVAKSPDVFIITQNGLGFASYYTDYLRLLYGSRLWVPSEKDVQQAFQQADERVKDINVWMRIVGALTKSIFDNNKDKHEFYVQESSVIGWMYPYLEPHGLIMKLNKEPLAQFDPVVVAEDGRFWGGLTKQLLADPKFLGNEWARGAFAKLRSAIGGLYAYRKLTSEAEAAFKQAVKLCPASPEANFRLAQLYVEASRFDDAINILQDLRQIEPRDDERQKVQEAIKTIQGMKQKATASEKP
jgi:hypothetical protein